jgi:hypothetical protein
MPRLLPALEAGVAGIEHQGFVQVVALAIISCCWLIQVPATGTSVR